MFKKLISSLPFSPALVGQLGFYAKRLKKEEATRKLGLIFTALALIVQSLAVFQPPESANASSANDMISGGFSTREQYISAYQANSGNIKDLFSVLGITQSDIQNAHEGSWNSHSNGGYSWGRLSRFSYTQGERAYTVPTSGGSTTFYYRPPDLSDTLSYTIKNGSTYQALIGKTATGMDFTLLKLCGNLVLNVTPPPVPCPDGKVGTYPDCTTPPKMCEIPGKTHLPANDSRCKPNQAAACESLSIDKIATNYQFTTTASLANGATISQYIYVIKRDGQVVATETIASTQTSNVFVYNQSKEGNYTVEATVVTSLGKKTSDDCVKTFNITAPAVCPQNPDILKTNPECQPCPGDSLLWIKDPKCSADLVQTKAAKNVSQNSVSAPTVTAKADDRIVYNLTVENKGTAPAEYVFVERIDDVIEYANIIDAGGGTKGVDPDTKTAIMSWPKVTVKPGEKITRMFTVQIMSTVPALAKGSSNPTSYDCRMSNTFGNNVTIAVDCPVQKQIIESITSELPHTGPSANMMIAGAVLAVVAFLYARTRLIKSEVRLIRRDFNTGTI